MTKTKCISSSHKFANIRNRKVELKFAGGDIISDGGVMLIKEADKRIGLLRAISRVCPESREKVKIEHKIENMLKQGVYRTFRTSYSKALACCYIRLCRQFMLTMCRQNLYI